MRIHSHLGGGIESKMADVYTRISKRMKIDDNLSIDCNTEDKLKRSVEEFVDTMGKRRKGLSRGSDKALVNAINNNLKLQRRPNLSKNDQDAVDALLYNTEQFRQVLSRTDDDTFVKVFNEEIKLSHLQKQDGIGVQKN